MYVRDLSKRGCAAHHTPRCLPSLRVQSKVDAVTGVMQKNIEMALRNTDR